MKRKRLFYNLICPLIGVALIVGVWAIVAVIYDKPLIVPSAASVVSSFFLLFAEESFYADIGLTLARSVACFALSYVLALPLALLAAFNTTFANIFKPLVEVLRSVPVIAVILIALTLFSSAVLPIAVGFLMVFPLTYSALLNSLTTDEVKLNLEMCAVYSVRKCDVVRYVYLPTVAPASFCQAKTLLPLCVKVVVSGEALAYSRVGLGLAMQASQINVQIDRLVAYALVAIVLSYLCLGLVTLVEFCCRRFKLCR